MKQFNTLFILFMCFGATLQAQDTRYVDEVFDNINIAANQPYATNISVLTMANGDPDTIALTMDVYTPADDTVEERPVVIYIHTGSFLPQYFSGQVTGGKSDSTVVEICTRLAKRGYTAIAMTYRAGWLPTAPDQNIRTATLLQASYRGIQDLRSCIRYLRKSAAEDGNPFGVDSDRIVAWGQGTGGYLSLGAATLDDYSEISDLDKFINTVTFEPYITEAIHGDIDGTQAAFLNLPNSVGYSSDFHLAVNMGGALADTSWINGASSSRPEPAIIGYHVVTDPFAPFGDGPVIVPTTNEFVVQVAGTRLTVEVANAKGLNDALTPVLSDTEPLSALLNGTVAALSGVSIDLSALGQSPTTLAEPHMYPFITPGFRIESGPWDWWGKPQLDGTISVVNSLFGTDFSSDTLHMNGLLTNPNMSAEKARTYIDTVMAHFLPRSCQVLQLSDCAIVSTEELVDDSLVGLQVSPNPAIDRAFIQTNTAYPMESIQLFDVNGRYIRAHYNINSSQFRMERGDLPPGLYLVKVKVKEGVSIRKLIFN